MVGGPSNPRRIERWESPVGCEYVGVSYSICMKRSMVTEKTAAQHYKRRGVETR
jgi:hypothetical protein